MKDFRNVRLKVKIIALFFLLICFQALEAQNYRKQLKLPREDAKKLEKADYLFEDENFKEAFAIYEELNTKYPNKPYIMHGLATAGLYVPKFRSQAVAYLEKVKEMAPEMDENINLNLAIANYLNYNFEAASDYLSQYTKQYPSGFDEDLVGRYSSWITNSMDLIQNPRVAEIENLGNNVNTEGNEYSPLISLDEQLLFYTYEGPKSKGGRMNAKLKPDPKGSYFEDIFVARKIDTVWQSPIGIEELNTLGHDAVISINSDGTKIFLYRFTEKDGGDIYYSELVGGVWEEPKRLGPNINTKYWEGSCSLSPDENTLYFASERPGGLGGRDLWKSDKQADGDWGPAKNLGPVINTALEEDAPFIHPFGNYLFFSSTGHNTMGGYDIFLSKIADLDIYETPKNLGPPINTVNNDKYYVLTPDSRSGYYSSERDDGYGGQDIYRVKAAQNILTPAALVEGYIFAEGINVPAMIEVTSFTNKYYRKIYKANETTGRYIISLEAGDDYNVKFTWKDYRPAEQYFDFSDLIAFSHYQNDIKFFKNKPYEMRDSLTPKMSIIPTLTAKDTLEKWRMKMNERDMKLAKIEEKKKREELDNEKRKKAEEELNIKKKVIDVYERQCDEQIAMVFSKDFMDANLNDEAVYKKFLETFGNYACQNLTFKVQIGAYRKPQNFKYDNLNAFGPADVMNYPDGITRFTMGEFETINKAEALRRQIIAAGTKDAWLVAFVKGDRKLMKEMFANQFFLRLTRPVK
jgi:hypothetical protein